MMSATAAVNCTDGSAGTKLTLTGMVGGIAQLGPSGATNDVGVTTGSPVRTFETVNYRLYNDGTGTWWLGVRSLTGGAWAATSPVAGPLRPNDGILFEYRTAADAITATPTAVARIRLIVRGYSRTQINIPGRRVGYYQDSIITRIALRNNVR